MIIDTKKIEKLLADESVSAYEIESKSGVNRTVLTKLRRGEAELDNMTLKNLRKLATYIRLEEFKMERKRLGDFGDFDLYLDGNEVEIKYHENVRMQDRTKFLLDDELASFMILIDEYDESEDADECEVALFGIADMLGI